MNEALASFGTIAARAGWMVSLRASPSLRLSDSFRDRFPRLPDDVLHFLGHVEHCANAADNVWFNCEKEFNLVDPHAAFPWNAFELMSAEAADDDAEWLENIKVFWDKKLPLVMSVMGDYDYVAVDLSDRGFGHVVHGSGPEFEECSEISSTFGDFVTSLATAIRDGHGSGVYAAFV